VGLALSAAVSRMLAGWIYGVGAFEPAVFIGTSLLLVAAMLLACYLPARRATAVEPVTALRNQ
jgi:macrolide transport system ATP-binding/permease protein